MGTPAFAVSSLRALASATTLVGVVSQPDRPRGRGLASQPSPVAAAAGALGAPLLRPASVRTPETFEALSQWKPDLLVVAAYGKILPPALLDLPTLAPINVHASLLPRYRGAGPIAASILAGDAATGVTIMLMSEAMDAGDMLLQRTLAIGADDTTETLTTALAELGASALVDALTALRRDGLTAEPQDLARVTYAPRLAKDDGRIDWQRDAAAIERMIRAFSPWPSAFTTLAGRTVKMLTAAVVHDATPRGTPGAITMEGGRFLVATGAGMLAITTLQPEGRKAMAASAFAAGARLASDARFE
ncbi:MAG: methionyl-tRNA formyltransferase [Candidatus Binatia bacterium]